MELTTAKPRSGQSSRASWLLHSQASGLLTLCWCGSCPDCVAATWIRVCGFAIPGGWSRYPSLMVRDQRCSCSVTSSGIAASTLGRVSSVLTILACRISLLALAFLVERARGIARLLHGICLGVGGGLCTGLKVQELHSEFGRRPSPIGGCLDGFGLDFSTVGNPRQRTGRTDSPLRNEASKGRRCSPDPVLVSSAGATGL